METEEVTLLTITSKNGMIHIEVTDDTNKYQLLGIIRSYSKALEEDLINEWIYE